jgi:nucleoside-diphosphate-sugar epimerase
VRHDPLRSHTCLICTPVIPYGISKIIAEYIHRQWQATGQGRCLSIIRPAVVFGKGERGSFTRIANALWKGLFVYRSRTDTLKACCYVKHLCRFVIQFMHTPRTYTLRNFCYPYKVTTEAVRRAFHEALGYTMPKAVLPPIGGQSRVHGARRG